LSFRKPCADKAVQWADGHDESVEVNQRALIDKILARYSGEFTVFRELLQNSDDAQAKAVEIRFETQGFLDKKKGGTSSLDFQEHTSDTLPDLRTAMVSLCSFHTFHDMNLGSSGTPMDF
jgi:hypothetical protein